MDDHVLLREYVASHSERAFAQLVERHLPVVYASALRFGCGDAHTAQDIAQAVFIQLAGKAGTIRDGHALPGWLYRATQRAAAVVFRGEGRRRQRETTAMNLAEQNATPDPDWAQISPLVDAALDRLEPVDQEAVVLRFFHEKSYREIGTALGLNEEAARKRVERALEAVRGHFMRVGVTTTAALLGPALTAHAAVLPPAAFATSLPALCLASATTAGVGASGGTLFFMSTQTKIIVAALVVAFVAAIPLTLQQRKIRELTTQLEQKPAASASTAKVSTEVAKGIQAPAARPTPPEVAAPAARPVTASQTVNAPTTNPTVQKVMVNNLRQLSSAAMQYMLDKGVTEAGYFDLVGSGTDAYIREVSPANGEDYTGVVIHIEDTQVSVVGADGVEVTYNL